MQAKGWGMAQKMRHIIEEKLAKVDASSANKAVTPDEAKLTFPEQNWLLYLTGGMASRIRKTNADRYYLRKR